MKINILIRQALIAGALAVTFASCTNSTVSQSFDWPRWRGPNDDGISQETKWDPKALKAGPRVLWKAAVGVGYSNVVIKGNRLYTIGVKKGENVVQCLGSVTGKKIWQYSLTSTSDPQSTPTVDGSSVYTISKEGILLCLNSQNGELRWKKDLVADYGAVKPYYGFAGSPVIDEDLLLLTVNSAGLALNRETGQVVWDSAAPREYQGVLDGLHQRHRLYHTYYLRTRWKTLCLVFRMERDLPCGCEVG